MHLIGVPHPSPAKAQQFQEIDLVSIGVATKAAREAGVQHFVYLSVAHPAPMMKAFIEVRRQGEEMIRQIGAKATFVRPWYVLGPGTSLGLRRSAVLLDLRTIARYPGVGAASWPGYD